MFFIKIPLDENKAKSGVTKNIIRTKEKSLENSRLFLKNILRKMGLEPCSALGNTVERSFFAPHFDLETFWKHWKQLRVCLRVCSILLTEI